jgi:hypothetical protein
LAFYPESKKEGIIMIWFLLGLLGGAGVMYFLDPRSGSRRRALAKDQGIKYSNDAQELAERVAEEARNRTEGMVHEAQKRMSEDTVDNATLEARVKSAIGRAVSNPGGIEITVQNGHVTLRGPVLRSEVDSLMKTAESVPGVDEVHNYLDVHETRDGIPSLQQ